MMSQDQPITRARARAVFLAKFDGDPKPGDTPAEMIEIRYDDAENVLSRDVHTDPQAIEECLARRQAVENGVI